MPTHTHTLTRRSLQVGTKPTCDDNQRRAFGVKCAFTDGALSLYVPVHAI